MNQTPQGSNPTSTDNNPTSPDMAWLDEILERYKSWLIGRSADEKNWLTKAEAKDQIAAHMADREKQTVNAALDSIEVPKKRGANPPNGRNQTIEEVTASIERVRSRYI